MSDLNLDFKFLNRSRDATIKNVGDWIDDINDENDSNFTKVRDNFVALEDEIESQINEITEYVNDEINANTTLVNTKISDLTNYVNDKNVEMTQYVDSEVDNLTGYVNVEVANLTTFVNGEVSAVNSNLDDLKDDLDDHIDDVVLGATGVHGFKVLNKDLIAFLDGENWIYIDLKHPFNFDNLAALQVVTRRTAFETETEILEEIRTTTENVLVATRRVVEDEDENITSVEIVYESDGVTILRQSTITTIFGEDDSVTEVVS